MNSTILAKWHYQSTEDSSGWVYPDGCRDVIVRYGKGKAPAWTITAVDATARVVENY